MERAVAGQLGREAGDVPVVLERSAAGEVGLGFEVVATRGTAQAIERARIPVKVVNKVAEGTPHVVDAIRGGEIALVVNTTIGAREVRDSYSLRRQTLLMNIPYFTTIPAGLAVCDALEAVRGDGSVRVRSLQEWSAESV